MRTSLTVRPAVLLAAVILAAAGTSAQEPTDPAVAVEEPPREAPPAAPVEEPQPELERPTVWGEPTEVQIGIYILASISLTWTR